ncbi:glycosyl transferase [Aequorivita sp. 609]|uniref:glycosyltransferase n=1 Tax=Aequorivita TaxID=153265 RepID=UPI001614E6FE|nr:MULTISPECIES: glycosyltransferase [Aequorivita]MBB6681127.1 glycosyl transferase [Aequorivita sp. 609]
MAIPKIIHYCWFGGKDFPQTEQSCIATWKKILPDYKLMLWNEENTILEIPFVKFAFENKQWAYVSDYVRLKCLYDYGGVYLDTDMYVVRSFNSFMDEICFFGSESSSRISCGIIGAEKHNEFIKKCLEYYENLNDFGLDDFKMPITKIVTQIFREYYNYNEGFSNTVRKDGVTIYRPEFFYPIPYNEYKRPLDRNYEEYSKENTFAIHLWSGSWQKINEFQLLTNKKYFKAILNILKKAHKKDVFKKKYLKKLLKAYKLSRHS